MVPRDLSTPTFQIANCCLMKLGPMSRREQTGDTAFLCAIAGIANEHTDRNTTAYIQNWIAKLEEDNRLIVHAAANAQRAVDPILGSTFEEEKETTENAGDATVSGIAAVVPMNIAPAIYGHAHL